MTAKGLAMQQLSKFYTLLGSLEHFGCHIATQRRLMLVLLPRSEDIDVYTHRRASDTRGLAISWAGDVEP